MMFSVRSQSCGKGLLASFSILALALGTAVSTDLSCAPDESGACSSSTASTLYQTTRALYPDLDDEALEDDADKLMSLVDEPASGNTTSANKTSANASANASGELLLGTLGGGLFKNATSAPAAASEDAEGEGEAEGASEDSDAAALGNGTTSDVTVGEPSEDEQAELDASLDVAVGPTLNGTAPPEEEEDENFGEPQVNDTDGSEGEGEAASSDGEDQGAVDDAEAVANEGEAAAANAGTSAPDAAGSKDTTRFKILRSIGIRKKPTEDESARIGKDVNEGEVVEVTVMKAAPQTGDGHKYLKLADGRGWIFTHSHRDGAVIAKQMEDAAAGPAPKAAAGANAGGAAEAEGEADSTGDAQNEADEDTDMQDDAEADEAMEGGIGVEGAEGPPINGSAVADFGVVEGDAGDDMGGNSSTAPDAMANASLLARMNGLEIASVVRHAA